MGELIIRMAAIGAGKSRLNEMLHELYPQTRQSRIVEINGMWLDELDLISPVAPKTKADWKMTALERVAKKPKNTVQTSSLLDSLMGLEQNERPENSLATKTRSVTAQ